MTTATQQPALQPLLSARTHAAAAFAVAAFVALAWTGAGQASHQAVEATTAAISGPAVHVTLPTVAIVAPRTLKVSALAAPSAL